MKFARYFFVALSVTGLLYCQSIAPYTAHELAPAGTKLQLTTKKSLGIQTTRIYGFGIFFGFFPVVKTSLQASMAIFSAQAKKYKARSMRIFNIATTDHIWALPPLSWIVTPIIVEISGELFSSDPE